MERNQVRNIFEEAHALRQARDLAKVRKAVNTLKVCFFIILASVAIGLALVFLSERTIQP